MTQQRDDEIFEALEFSIIDDCDSWLSDLIAQAGAEPSKYLGMAREILSSHLTEQDRKDAAKLFQTALDFLQANEAVDRAENASKAALAVRFGAIKLGVILL